jgi:hypothetical protein
MNKYRWLSTEQMMEAGDGLCILIWPVTKTMNSSVRDQHVGFQIENSSKFVVLATGLVLAKRIFLRLDELPANEYQASRHAELIWIEGVNRIGMVVFGETSSWGW